MYEIPYAIGLCQSCFPYDIKHITSVHELLIKCTSGVCCGSLPLHSVVIHLGCLVGSSVV